MVAKPGLDSRRSEDQISERSVSKEQNPSGEVQGSVLKTECLQPLSPPSLPSSTTPPSLPPTRPSAPCSPLFPPAVSWHGEERPFDSCGGGEMMRGWGVPVLLESDSLAVSYRLFLQGVFKQPERRGARVEISDGISPPCGLLTGPPLKTGPWRWAIRLYAFWLDYASNTMCNLWRSQ